MKLSILGSNARFDVYESATLRVLTEPRESLNNATKPMMRDEIGQGSSTYKL